MSAWFALFLALSAPAQSVGDLLWLSGVWMSRSGDGRWADEYWTLPRDGLMLGAGMAGQGEKVNFFEHMRIATDRSGQMAFFAMSNGGPAVVFPVVRQGPNLVVFENPKHDYPQRITYSTDGQRLTAIISQMDGSRAMRWDYQRPN